MTPLAWAKLAALIIGGALLFGGPAYKIGHWLGHRSGVDDGRAEERAVQLKELAKRDAEIQRLNASLAPKQAEIAQAVSEAIAEAPKQRVIVEKIVDRYPEWAALERPRELHEAKVQRLLRIVEALK